MAKNPEFELLKSKLEILFFNLRKRWRDGINLFFKKINEYVKINQIKFLKKEI